MHTIFSLLQNYRDSALNLFVMLPFNKLVCQACALWEPYCDMLGSKI